MKKFLAKLFAFLLVIATSFILIGLLADGYTDPFYLRFTSPKQTSLIIGTSRAAQGIQPISLNSFLKDQYTGLQSYNFSFTVVHSPYGPTYYRSIKEKLDNNAKKSLFILAVDPWAISSKSKQPNDSTEFPENNMFLANTHLFNIEPNLEYLIKNYNEPLLTLITNKVTSSIKSMLLHDDGWLEVSVPMDSNFVAGRISNKISEYKKNMLPYYKFSTLRLRYLEKTIQLLQNHGDVYLVRIPVANGMFELEKKLIPNFDILMNKLAKENRIAYLNYMYLRENYDYTDGNHLYKSSGKKFTNQLAKDIINSKSFITRRNNYLTKTK